MSFESRLPSWEAFRQQHYASLGQHGNDALRDGSEIARQGYELQLKERYTALKEGYKEARPRETVSEVPRIRNKFRRKAVVGDEVPAQGHAA